MYCIRAWLTCEYLSRWSRNIWKTKVLEWGASLNMLLTSQWDSPLVNGMAYCSAWEVGFISLCRISVVLVVWRRSLERGGKSLLWRQKLVGLTHLSSIPTKPSFMRATFFLPAPSGQPRLSSLPRTLCSTTEALLLGLPGSLWQLPPLCAAWPRCTLSWGMSPHLYLYCVLYLCISMKSYRNQELSPHLLSMP